MARVPKNKLAGSRVAHYAIVDLIGSGSMGQVYRARDERLHRDVAIKVLGSDVGTPARQKQRLMTEAQLLARVNHPSIARIYEFIIQAGRDFMVMEFVAGATLKDVIAGGPLPAAEVLRLCAQLASGLDAAHQAHVVHKDIKPANLKVTSYGDLKILDFGVAKLLPYAAAEVPTQTAPDLALVGTIPYMPPEQLRGEFADERSDLFSAGAVLYEMATRRPAFPQQQLVQLIDAILHDSPVAPSSINPFVPPALEQVIMKALEKRPCDRYRSAADLGDALEELMDAHQATRGLMVIDDAVAAAPA
jgi:serine/threonine protein kinase